jgi:ATP/maltotriose-dependent transcriptional regulator MalT
VVLEHLIDVVPPTEPDELYLLGTAACVVGAAKQSLSFLGAAASRLREQGRLGMLAQVLKTRAWSAILTADYDAAELAAQEAEKLAAETSQPLFQAGAWCASATVAAVRGEQDKVERLTADAERVALGAGASGLLGLVQYARATLSLALGRHAEAFDSLRRVTEPGDPAHLHWLRAFCIGDLTEAAVYSGHRDYARMEVERLEPLCESAPSPWLNVVLPYAKARLADDSEAEEMFAQALSHNLTDWPFVRARFQLGFGQWLRRQRRSAESRAPLRAARDAFDALGVEPWSQRARQELRASGETSRRRVPGSLDQLTPQELQIVQMAADGLSNGAIAQRLYISRRTVESHLYRVYPKIGVTSRAQLQATLRQLDEQLAATVGRGQ